MTVTDLAILLGHKPPPPQTVRGARHLGFSAPEVRTNKPAPLPEHPWLRTKAQKRAWRSLEQGPATAADIHAEINGCMNSRSLSNMLNTWCREGRLEIMCVTGRMKSRVYRIKGEAK